MPELVAVVLEDQFKPATEKDEEGEQQPLVNSDAGSTGEALVTKDSTPPASQQCEAI